MDCQHHSVEMDFKGNLICKNCNTILSSDDLHKDGVEYNITKRWENGIEHHPRSVELYNRLEAIDWFYGGDSFCFKSGGDGDNGETLMYLLDILFQEKTDALRICHDCGVKEGELHKPGCDMERCPFCGRQIISCSCKYKLLGYDYDWNKPFSGLPKEVYENGLSDEEYSKWEKMLEEKGLIPFIKYPVICSKCGKLWPEFFRVPDEEWKKYIEPAMQNTVICRHCYDLIKDTIDGANK